MTTKVIKTISDFVPANTEIAEIYVPADGEKFRVYQLAGSSPNSVPYSVVELVWDYDGAGQELLWTINTDEPLPEWLQFEVVGDGVKKLALVLDNGSGSGVYMSASFRGEIYE